MSIRTVGVVGAGQMGAGIAQVAAQAGYQVLLADISAEVLARSVAGIERRLARLVSKGRLTQEQADEARGRLGTTTSLADFSAVDFAVEAVSENMGLKKKIFAQLDEALPEGAILASNTSSISITALAFGTSRPDRVIGMHFMNPVPVMKLVEVIRGLATSQETLDETLALGAAMGKTCVSAADQPGFVVNRILMPMINEAFFALYEGIGDAEGIDAAMKLGCNFPMGPLNLADFIGLDTCLAIMEVLHQGLGDPKYRPCPLLRKYVEAGWLGKKTGRGVFTYEARR